MTYRDVVRGAARTVTRRRARDVRGVFVSGCSQARTDAAVAAEVAAGRYHVPSLVLAARAEALVAFPDWLIRDRDRGMSWWWFSSRHQEYRDAVVSAVEYALVAALARDLASVARVPVLEPAQELALLAPLRAGAADPSCLEWPLVSLDGTGEGA